MGERDLSGLGESLVSPDKPDKGDTKNEEVDDDTVKAGSADTTTASSETTNSSSSSPTASDSGSPSASTEYSQGRDTQCQETTRDGTQCDHDALPNSPYCKKHQPDKFGHQRGDFKRKQWTLLPAVADRLFADSVTANSLYINVQKEIGEEFQKKSIENKMGEFLVSREEEFIEYVSQEYDTQSTTNK